MSEGNEMITLTFNVADGDERIESSTMEVPRGTRVETPPVPNRAAGDHLFAFAGWSIDGGSCLDDFFAEGGPVEEPMSFTAQWKKFACEEIEDGIAVVDRTNPAPFGFCLSFPDEMNGRPIREFRCSILNNNGPLRLPSSLRAIGDKAFNGLYFSGRLDLPDTLESIGDGAFGGCYKFTGDLRLPESVRKIDDYAFGACSGFDGALVLSPSLEAVSREVFHNCKGFKTLVIPEGVRSIGSMAFRCCEGLEGTLDLPSTIEKIDAMAFDGCSGLNGHINMAPEKPPVINPEMDPFNFYWDENRRMTLHVPASSLEAYRKARGYADLYDIAGDYPYREEP